MLIEYIRYFPTWKFAERLIIGQFRWGSGRSKTKCRTLTKEGRPLMATTRGTLVLQWGMMGSSTHEDKAKKGRLGDTTANLIYLIFS